MKACNHFRYVRNSLPTLPGQEGICRRNFRVARVTILPSHRKMLRSLPRWMLVNLNRCERSSLVAHFEPCRPVIIWGLLHRHCKRLAEFKESWALEREERKREKEREREREREKERSERAKRRERERKRERERTISLKKLHIIRGPRRMRVKHLKNVRRNHVVFRYRNSERRIFPIPLQVMRKYTRLSPPRPVFVLELVFSLRHQFHWDPPRTPNNPLIGWCQLLKKLDEGYLPKWSWVLLFGHEEELQAKIDKSLSESAWCDFGKTPTPPLPEKANKWESKRKRNY